MCTVTWRPSVDGYDLFFNRDELRTRATARPPSEAGAESVRYLAPTDSDAGGTWVAVNELGTTVGLLNAHPPAASAPRRLLSRGLLVRKLADLEDADRLESRLSGLALERLRPCTVFAVSLGGAAVGSRVGRTRALLARLRGRRFCCPLRRSTPTAPKPRDGGYWGACCVTARRPSPLTSSSIAAICPTMGRWRPACIVKMRAR